MHRRTIITNERSVARDNVTTLTQEKMIASEQCAIVVVLADALDAVVGAVVGAVVDAVVDAVLDRSAPNSR